MFTALTAAPLAEGTRLLLHLMHSALASCCVSRCLPLFHTPSNQSTHLPPSLQGSHPPSLPLLFLHWPLASFCILQPLTHYGEPLAVAAAASSPPAFSSCTMSLCLFRYDFQFRLGGSSSTPASQHTRVMWTNSRLIPLPPFRPTQQPLRVCVYTWCVCGEGWGWG